MSGIECNKIWNIGETLNFSKGDTILSAKEKAKGIYVVLSGSVAMSMNDKPPVTFKGGDYFGEFGSLADVVYHHTYSTLEVCTICLIKTDELEDLMEEDGSIARKVYRIFTQELIKRLSEEQISSILSKVS